VPILPDKFWKSGGAVLAERMAAELLFTAMLRRVTTALMALLLLAGNVSAGVGAHHGAGECKMHGMADCCEVAMRHSDAPEVKAARLCCLVNCHEPGPAGRGFNAPAAPEGAAASPRAAAVRAYDLRPGPRATPYDSPPHASHSPPPYIQHLALLI